jgi:hypothetical protein
MKRVFFNSIIRVLVLVLVIPFALRGQLGFNGKINPYGLYRISDGSEISLPFRLFQLELSYSWGAFDLKTNSALEYRWSTGENSFDLREAYLIWYPEFGEVKLGKQIHAWGAADGNNPTDNLNAYDYYYLFLPGAERKIGVVSLSSTIYFGDWQIEGVLIPEHERNRMPYNEPDFPVAPAFEPQEEQIEVPDQPWEYGFRVRTMVGESDLSWSYFHGYDRGLSMAGIEIIMPPSPDAPPLTVPHFGFRKTEVFGADFVTFPGDLSVRGELAYFNTYSDFDSSWTQSLDSKAKYIQYVMQVEYTGPFDIQFMGQFIGNKVLEADGEVLDFETFQVIPLTEDNFLPGMGTPFAMFADRALMVTATGNFFDDRLEVLANGFFNLDEPGSMLGLGVSWTPFSNWGIVASLIKLKGDENDPENAIAKLEDFSHLNLGLEYNF